jgi:hypothetical protein
MYLQPRTNSGLIIINIELSDDILLPDEVDELQPTAVCPPEYYYIGGPTICD